MKLLVLVVCSLALVAADVSHLFGNDHHHHHHHEEEHEHPGYHYDAPQIPFELPTRIEEPKPTYLPPAPPKPAYLPPAPPKAEYLPPKPAYIPPVAPLPTVAAIVEQPESNYLPPVSTNFKIPIPSYAAPLEPENTYLPPQEVIEPHSEDGYHYNAPSKPFFY